MHDKNHFAMALDGHHHHVDTITSNPAECLWSRLIDEDRAEAMAATLMSDAMRTGWGVRTMASTELAYNAFSYHDGSIWPFENALITSGLKKYGFVHEAQTLIAAMIAASGFFEYRRWPEVYAGVSADVGGVLAIQPDASRPQAWSAGAIFLLLQTILGISTEPFSRRVDVTPALSSGIDEIVVDNLHIAGCTLGLRLVRHDTGVLMEIFKNPDELDVIVHPGRATITVCHPAVRRFPDS